MLAINDGGSPEKNYQSHLLHLKELLALFPHQAAQRERITVLASDGPDPAPDLAVHEVELGDSPCERKPDAQSAAVSFYEPFGFVPEGDEFLDAGIPHRRMRLRL